MATISGVGSGQANRLINPSKYVPQRPLPKPKDPATIEKVVSAVQKTGLLNVTVGSVVRELGTAADPGEQPSTRTVRLILKH